VNRNFQLGIHPDADQLSVFVEGAATSREHERMLAHLAECAECRKAVFFMQPHEETQPATRTPAKGWIWGRLLPVGLPAAALACGLVALLAHIWPGDGAPRIPQQNVSATAPDIQLPQTTVAPTTDSNRVARSVRPKNSFAPNAAATGLSRQENPVAGDLNLPKSKSGQAATNVAASETADARLSANAQVADAARVKGGVSGVTSSELPLNGRNLTNLVQLPTPSDTQGAASQNSLAKERTLPQLEIAQDSGQAEAFAGVSGRITDRSGATISGARVSLRDAGGKTRQTITSADGSFHLTELPAGRYELIATASGFKTIEQSIQLNPSQLAMLQPVLDIGTTSEQVTVEEGAQTVNTEDASLTQNVDARVFGGNGNGLPQNGYARVFGGNGDGHSVSHGKRFLSLESTGNLFLSRNGGKKWKKIRPQWTGKAVRIELTPAYRSEAPPKPKNETLGQASEVAVFLLTTDAGTVWTSKDGAHWHQQ
jgi:Carboxypeptidase regulatory-like domain/Putative zinc-finger